MSYVSIANSHAELEGAQIQANETIMSNLIQIACTYHVFMALPEASRIRLMNIIQGYVDTNIDQIEKISKEMSRYIERYRLHHFEVPSGEQQMQATTNGMQEPQVRNQR